LISYKQLYEQNEKKLQMMMSVELTSCHRYGDMSGATEDLMLMTRENQALISELLVVEDKMS
jgi:hypothetical protein